jgi:hypothetical protein
MQEEMKQIAAEVKAEMEKDGVIVTLTADEAKVVRKVLSCVNTLYTVVEPEYKENKIDAILRKLRRFEE